MLPNPFAAQLTIQLRCLLEVVGINAPTEEIESLEDLNVPAAFDQPERSRESGKSRSDNDA